MTAVRRSRRRISPWWALLLLPVGAGVLFATGAIKPPGATSATETKKLETVTVARSTFRVAVTGPGTVGAANSADIKPQVGGTILSIVKVGDRVTRGQLLARLDPTNYQRAFDNARLNLAKAQTQLASQQANVTTTAVGQQQQVASAQAQFDNAQLTTQTAQTTLANQQRLFAIGGASQQDVVNAQNALTQARTNLENARVALKSAKESLSLRSDSGAQDLQNLRLAVEQAQISFKNAQSDLANTKIYAPFNGVVSVVNGAVGGSALGTGSASGGGALLTLIDDGKVQVPAQIDETEIGQVKLGQKANVTLDALPGQTFVGTVTSISPSATIVSNIAVFYATVTLENPDRVVRPGMSAEAEIVSREIEDALIIPKRAVQTVRRRSYVDVLGADGKTQDTVRVTTGPDDGTNIVVTDGLTAGQTIVLPTRGSNSVQNQGGPGGGP